MVSSVYMPCAIYVPDGCCFRSDAHVVSRWLSRQCLLTTHVSLLSIHVDARASLSDSPVCVSSGLCVRCLFVFVLQVWVPALSEREDMQGVVQKAFQFGESALPPGEGGLTQMAGPMLDFAWWFNNEVRRLL